MKAKSLKQKEGFEIVWKPMLAYGIWFLIRTTFTKFDFLLPIWATLNNTLAAFYVKVSAKTLEFLGHTLVFNSRNLLMGNNQEMYVGDHCLGISAMVIFTLIILLLQGNFKHKSWFILFGLGLIFLANWFRIVGLALMLKLGSPAFFHFNHSYTYLLMVYGLIFLLILWYQNKISKF